MSWKNFQSSLGSSLGQLQKGVQSLDLAGASSKVTKTFNNVTQQIKESTGNEQDVTELPEEYLVLERRVDALRNAHANLLKITKVYETETYDYPTNIGENISEVSQTISHSVTSLANMATQGTNLPKPAVAEKPPAQHKTLPHALSRASASGSVLLRDVQQSDHLAKALQDFSIAQDGIGTARLDQDAQIAKNCNAVWQASLTQINAAMKARASVKTARLSLDATRSRNRNVTGPNAERSRLEIEAAEDHLFKETQEAITLMQAVLENPSSLTALVQLVKAQQTFYAKAAETLGGITSDLEEAATRAEADYRKTLNRA